MNESAIPLFFLFAVVIVAVYMVTRRRMLPLMPVVIVGAVVNTIVMMIYFIGQQFMTGYAVLIGAAIGGGMTILSAIFARHFAEQEASRDITTDDAL